MNMFNISFSYAIQLRMITRRRSYDESNEKQVVHSYRYILPTSCLSRLFFPMPILLVHSTPVTCTCTDVFTERPPRASDHCVDGLNAGVVVNAVTMLCNVGINDVGSLYFSLAIELSREKLLKLTFYCRRHKNRESFTGLSYLVILISAACPYCFSFCRISFYVRVPRPPWQREHREKRRKGTCL